MSIDPSIIVEQHTTIKNLFQPPVQLHFLLLSTFFPLALLHFEHVYRFFTHLILKDWHNGWLSIEIL